jgi:hypothetical protein
LPLARHRDAAELGALVAGGLRDQKQPGIADATGEIAAQVVAANGGRLAAEVVFRIRFAPGIEDARGAEGGELVDEAVDVFQAGLSMA